MLHRRTEDTMTRRTVRGNNLLSTECVGEIMRSSLCFCDKRIYTNTFGNPLTRNRRAHFSPVMLALWIAVRCCWKCFPFFLLLCCTTYCCVIFLLSVLVVCVLFR
ncbi:hypothetical protein, unlikely [Trypanosoma brucei gambiense DAL972]|uniref:Uncharacterized protein n=1 Tax=Trypanosoma brucei gambiense (strain MHOM/CI/86/DAL972) TaxID=679716 RepID=D0A9I6_TRYB9|nr:hypothetical protein, unlikely [Trypanosoma brucei gambiense DAL972]CBH18337.1 hypothetical protein, unlikely [Trypanosoma brucei gambiense DAL972]|eukprot:XP_011780601.1 hypothetical protein, unlikely [Trypanosoma brucei gambiense DAL972]